MGFRIAEAYADFSVRNLGRFTGQMSALRTRLVGVGAGFRGMIQSIGGFGALLGGISLIRITKEMADLEMAIAKVRKTSGLLGPDMIALREDLLKFSRGVGLVTTTDIMSIAEAAGQLGIRGKDNILQFTEVIAKLAATSDLAAEDGARAMAQVMNVFHLDPAKDLEHLANVFTLLGANTAATEGELAEMVLRMSGAGKLIGMTADQVTALAATMRDAGVPVEVAGTAMASVMLRLIKDSDKFAKVAGMSFAKFDKLAKEKPIDALKALSRNIATMDVDVAVKSLNALGLEGVRVGGAFAQLANVFDKFDENLRMAREGIKSTAALTAEFAIVSATAAAKWGRLKNVLATNMFSQPNLDALSHLLESAAVGVGTVAGSNPPGVGSVDNSFMLGLKAITLWTAEKTGLGRKGLLEAGMKSELGLLKQQAAGAKPPAKPAGARAAREAMAAKAAKAAKEAETEAFKHFWSRMLMADPFDELVKLSEKMTDAIKPLSFMDRANNMLEPFRERHAQRVDIASEIVSRFKSQKPVTMDIIGLREQENRIQRALGGHGVQSSQKSLQQIADEVKGERKEQRDLMEKAIKLLGNSPIFT